MILSNCEPAFRADDRVRTIGASLRCSFAVPGRGMVRPSTGLLVHDLHALAQGTVCALCP